MELILWRHAEAEDGWPDAQRKLTPKGRKQADRVGEWLRGRIGREYRVVASPALRAIETAKGLSGDVDILPGLSSGADVERLLREVGWPHTDLLTVVVGHQPTLGEVAARLLSGEPSAWGVKKGAAWWFRSKEGSGRLVTELRAVICPDLV